MDPGTEKNIVNTIYQSSLIAGTTIGYAYLSRKLFKMKIGDPAYPNFEEIIKLAALVGLSNGTLHYLYSKGIIPENIMK